MTRFALALLLAIGCGDDDAPEDGGRDSASDAAGDDDDASDDGGGDTGLRDADASDVVDSSGPRCPETPPTDGADCVTEQSCTYLLCADEGEVSASCDGDTWSVSTLPCAGRSCGSSEECGAEQICYEQSSGDLFVECRDNPCGEGPIDCECVECPSGFACATSGRNVYCRSNCADCP